MMKRYSLLLGLGGLAMALGGVGFAFSSQTAAQKVSAADHTYSYTFTGQKIDGSSTNMFKTTAGSVEIDGVTWSYSNSTFVGGNSSNGLQIGSKNTPQIDLWTFSTAISNFGKVTINSIAVTGSNASGGNGVLTIYNDSSNTTTALGSESFSATSNTYTFYTSNYTSWSDAGDIVIGFQATSSAMYFKTLTINYSDLSTDTAITLDEPSATQTTFDNGCLIPSDVFAVTGTKTIAGAVVEFDAQADVSITVGDGTTMRGIEFGVTTFELTDTVVRFTSKYPNTQGGDVFDIKDITITVEEPVDVSIAITGSLTNTTYYVGGDWSADGLSVTSTTENGWVRDVKSTAVSWSFSPEAPTLGVDEVTIAATYNDLIATHTEPVTVSEAIVYTQITSVDDLVQGMKLIITSGTDSSVKAMSTTQNKNNRAATSIAIANGQISSPSSSVAILTLGISGSNYTLYDPAYEGDEFTGGYLFAPVTTSSNNLRTGQYNSGLESEWSISFSTTGEASIVNQGEAGSNVMNYNTSSLFSCYSSTTTSTSVKPIYLYGYADQKIKDAKEFAETSDIVLVSACEALDVTSEDWNEIKVFSAEYSAEALPVLTNGTAGEADVIGQFLSRYDYIVNKYGYEDFLNRSTSNSNKVGGEVETSTTIGIAIAALAGILTIGAIALVYKRREN